jgi:phage tail-like protein
MATVGLPDRVRQKADPVRNFKYQVQMLWPDNPTLSAQMNEIGFMTVEGLAMNTEMVPYREGGWNTNPHKLPGQTDFAPLSLQSGVFYQKPGMWNAAKMMFAVQWGDGTLGPGQDYRYDMIIRVLDHPVTQGPASGVNGDISGSVMAFYFYNCWTASIGYNGLNSMDNAILVSQMTVHHEGFNVFYGPNEAVNASGNSSSNYLPITS